MNTVLMTDQTRSTLDFNPPDSPLGAQAARGLSFTLGSQIIKAGIQFISIIVLSRILTPADFGLFAMVTLFTGLIEVAKTGGLSAATIHEPDITHAKVSNLFWLNTLLGGVLSLVTLCLVPVIAWIFGDPRLGPMTAAMAIVFFLGGLSVQSDAILRRRLMFSQLAVIDVVSMAAGVLLSIGSALFGAGYWALVAGQVATGFLRSILVFVVAGWSPGRYQPSVDLRRMVAFGAQITGADIVSVIARNSVPFTIGLFSGPASLGIYNRANAVISIPSSQLLPPFLAVVQSTFARLTGDQVTLRKAIVSVLGITALIASVVTGIILATTDWVIILLLGKGWDEAVPFMRLLAVFMLVEPLASLLATAMMATGNGKLILTSKIVTFIAILGALVAGMWWGPIGIVAAVAVSGLFVRMPIFIWFAERALPIDQAEIYRTIAPPILAGIVMAGAIAACRMFLDVGPMVGLAITVPLGLGVFFLLITLFPQTRRQVWGTIRVARAGLKGDVHEVDYLRRDH